MRAVFLANLTKITRSPPSPECPRFPMSRHPHLLLDGCAQGRRVRPLADWPYVLIADHKNLLIVALLD